MVSTWHLGCTLMAPSCLPIQLEDGQKNQDFLKEAEAPADLHPKLPQIVTHDCEGNIFCQLRHRRAPEVYSYHPTHPANNLLSVSLWPISNPSESLVSGFTSKTSKMLCLFSCLNHMLTILVIAKGKINILTCYLLPSLPVFSSVPQSLNQTLLSPPSSAVLVLFLPTLRRPKTSDQFLLSFSE